MILTKFKESSIINNESENKYLNSVIENFHPVTTKWKLRYLRISEDQLTAFAVLEYNSNKKVHNIKALRDLSETKTFYSWRLLV